MFFQEVEQTKGDVLGAFKSAQGLSHRLVMGKFKPSKMYSTKRDLKVDFLMVTSDAVGAPGAPGEPACLWHKSSVWLRKDFGPELTCLPRTSFRNFAAPLLAPDSNNIDWATDFKQHVSGAEFWDEIFMDLCSNQLASSSLHVHIRELTMYDPEMGKAVANVRSRGSEATPSFAYVCVTHKDFLGAGHGTHLARHCTAHLRGHVAYLVERGLYRIDGFVAVPSGASGAQSTKQNPTNKTNTAKHQQN